VGRLLTKQERKLLEKELRLERYARFSDRIKCILLLDAGKAPESIAEYLFLSRNTAINYLKRYQAGGLKEIKTNSGRQRVNINGVVNAHDPTDVVIEESASINAQSTIKVSHDP
jgi:hypothetical protein